MSKKSYPTVTDQFCGAGGSSEGAVAAGAEVVLALNHWDLAIETHNTNFPDTHHDCTDISACDPRRYPSTDILITSPECTNHSLAKGKMRKHQAQLDLFGQVKIDPAEERSRATMWDVPRFAEFHNYNFVIVENVVDARNWRLFDAWIQAMDLLGYDKKIVYFNSQFAHPTPQSRDRMYVVFWKKGNKSPDLNIKPLAYCNKCGKDVDAFQAWKQPSRRRWGRYRKQYIYCCPKCSQEVTPYYYAAINAIDFDVPIERIGDRKRPLKKKTIARIEYGLEKYGYHPGLLTKFFSGKEHNTSLLEPTGTVTTIDHHGLVVPPFLVETGYTHSGDNRTNSSLEPIPTQTARQTLGVVVPPFVAELRGKSTVRELTDPLGTVTAIGAHHGLVVPPFIVELRRTGKARALTEALATMTASGYHHGLVIPFVTTYNENSTVWPVTNPAPTMTSIDRVAYVEPGEVPSVEDCGFRMLKPHEIGKAMAFPGDYVVLGTNRQKVRQYGNAVTPPVMKLLVERCLKTLG